MKKFRFQNNDIFRKSIGATFIKLTGITFSFIISAYFARNLTNIEFGVYELINRYLQLAVLFCLVGLQPALIKELSLLSEKNLMGSRIFTSLTISLLVALVIIIFINAFNDQINQFLTPELNLNYVVLITSISIVPMIVSRIYGAALLGKSRIIENTLVNNSATVLFLIIILSILVYLGYNLSLLNVIISYFISRVFVCISVMIFWHKRFKTGFVAKFNFHPLRKVASEMFGVTILNELFLSTNIIFLGIFGMTIESGYFAIALKITLLSNIFLQILNSTLSPKIAILFKHKKIKELNKLLQESTLLLVVIGVVITLFLIGLGKKILGIWGEEFTIAYFTLIMLSFGQFINVITGPVGTTMAMIGEEKTNRKLTLIYTLLNIMLVILLIPNFGMNGAAFAYMTSISLLNIHRLIYLRSCYNIKTLMY